MGMGTGQLEPSSLSVVGTTNLARGRHSRHDRTSSSSACLVRLLDRQWKRAGRQVVGITERNETLVVVACLCRLPASDFSATRSVPAVELPFRLLLAGMFNPCGLHVNGRYGVSLPASGDGHRRMLSASLDTSSHGSSTSLLIQCLVRIYLNIFLLSGHAFCQYF